MPERIALFGGTFNPIHFGHLITARAAAEQLGMSRVILLPSATPPHKAEHELIAAEHRAAMVRLAILGEPLFEVSDFDLTRPGPSYTVDTVTHFRALCAPGVELFWMIGADSLAELTTWRQLPDLVDKCRIITLSRTSAKPVDWSQFSAQLTEEQISRLRDGVLTTPTIQISATEIRRRIQDRASVRYLVPESVLDYISANGLYQSRADGSTHPH